MAGTAAYAAIHMPFMMFLLFEAVPAETHRKGKMNVRPLLQAASRPHVARLSDRESAHTAASILLEEDLNLNRWSPPLQDKTIPSGVRLSECLVVVVGADNRRDSPTARQMLIEVVFSKSRCIW